jgi:hypothetical protein
LPFLSQEAELLVQEIAELARQGLIGYPHIYETITGIRITTNFRRAFPFYKPSNFDLVKTIAGRRFDNANARKIREFAGFNSLSNFCQNHEYNYIVPAGWQNYLDAPPEVRVPQEDWWREYSEFRARIRAEHNEKKEALAREKAAAKARESSSGKDKGKGKGKPKNKGNGKGKGKGKAIELLVWRRVQSHIFSQARTHSSSIHRLDRTAVQRRDVFIPILQLDHVQ